MKETNNFAARLASAVRPSILALPISLMISGCANFSAEQTVSPRLAVDLPNDCERLAAEVPLPGNLDANGKRRTVRVVLRHTQAALVKANDELVQVRECVSDQRQTYGEAN
jgi:hypothetical protein